MTPLSPARRAADEFASVVDGARDDAADRYADLVATVDVLRAQGELAPRPDFVANLRERLMDAADTLLLPADDRAPSAVVVAFPDRAKRRQRRLSIAAAAFVVVGGTASVAAAAENSLPGDPLYPIKRGIESAQITFNSSDVGKGQDLLRQASTRLEEVNGLLDNHASAARITDTLSAFQSSATDGADLLFVSYQRTGDPSQITGLRAMLSSQLSTLDKLSANAPGDSTTAFSSAKSLVASLDQQARVLCGACGSDTSLGTPTSAPALSTLLTAPAAYVQKATLADKNKHLADLANQIAQQTPQTPVTPPATTSTGPVATRPSLPGLPGLPSPTSTPVKDTISGVANGVGALLESLTEPLAPVTNTIGNTLNTLSGGLTTTK